MERIIALSLVLVIIGIGIAAGIAGGIDALTPHDSWTPREYVAKPGDCFVPPQGDPLYDEHYAKNVNAYNCEALKDQSEAKQIDAQARNLDAQTRRTNAETSGGILGVLSFLAVVASILVLVVAALRR